MSSIRVLAVCAVNGHGGPVQSLATVIRHSAGAASVTVATQPSMVPHDAAVDRVAAGVLVIPRPRGRLLPVAQVKLIWAYLSRRCDFDVIHSNGLTEAVVVLPLAFVSRRPVVVWVHNFERPRPYALVEPLLRRFGRRWTFVAVSQLAAGQVQAAACSRIANPIDGPPRSWIASERPSTGGLRVAYLAGSDRAYKGFDLLPEVVERSSAHVVWDVYTSPPFSSDSPECTAAWQRLLELQAEGRVNIHGRVPSLHPVFAELDLVFAPSRRESFNRVIAEGLAFGIPAVASDISPHRELLMPDAGFVFPVGDAQAAASLIDRIADDPELLAKARAGAHAVAGRFEPSAIAEQLRSEWLRAVDAHGPRQRTRRNKERSAA
jgi:glycosyltransferase involved in cell wall biosynthesis